MFLVGDPVQITPRSPEAKKFWGFVSGWCGEVGGMNNGAVVVHAHGKTFFVEPANVTKLHIPGK